MPVLELTRITTRIVGVKAIRRIIGKKDITLVIVAKDAESAIVDELVSECQRLHIPVQYIATRQELGTACGLRVGAAAVALVDQSVEGEISADD